MVDQYLDSAEKVFKLLAYAIGAAWVYFNYFKGRTYKQRLDTKVKATFMSPPNEDLVSVALTLKNIGLSRLEIVSRGSAIRVEAYDRADETWVSVDAYPLPLFSDDDPIVWLEPGEALEEQCLVHLTEPIARPFRVQLLVASQRSVWDASTLVVLEKGERS